MSGRVSADLVAVALTPVVLAAVVLAAGPAGSAGAAAGRAAGAVPGGTISTVAGGPGGPAPGTAVTVVPCGTAFTESDPPSPSACDAVFAGGRLYLTDFSGENGQFPTGQAYEPPGNVIRSVSLATGRLATPVGDGDRGFSGDSGRAGAAALSQPGGVAIDRAGNVIVADTGNNRIRVRAAASGRFYGRAMVAGRIYTVAGNGTHMTSGDGGPARSAGLFSPGNVRMDQAGNLVIAQDGDISGDVPVAARIRVVAERSGTLYGRKMTAGDIYPVISHGLGVTVIGIRLDHAGNIVVADASGDRVKVMAVRSGPFYGRQMTAGHLYTVAGGGTGGLGDGGPATRAELSTPESVAVDRTGNLVIADTAFLTGGVGRVRVVAVRSGTFYGQAMTAGDIYTVAGGGASLSDGVPATSASLRMEPGAAVAVDGAGNLVVTDSGNFRVRVVAAASGKFYGQNMTAGDIYTVAGTGTEDVTGDGGLAARAQLDGPFMPAAASDPAGDLAIAGSSRVRFVPARPGRYFGRQMAARRIYTVAGDGAFGFSGDGGPATLAQLATPESVTLNHAGNLVITDSDNNRVRVVADRSGLFYGQPMTAGDIYTIAGSGSTGQCDTPPFSGDGGPATSAHLCGPAGVAVDHAGNVVVADVTNARIRVVAVTSGTFYGQPMTAGSIYTVAGSGRPGLSGDGRPALKAQLALPQPAQIAIDAAGNLVLPQIVSIRVVAATSGTFYGQPMTGGDIYTVAGRGTSKANGVPATHAKITYAYAAAVDASGNLAIEDIGTGLVRAVAARTGVSYGQPMTAGDIYTVAGGGAGPLGDGGPATATSLACPTSVAPSASGGILITEACAGRIREVAP